jgi:hypothetical protein
MITLIRTAVEPVQVLRRSLGLRPFVNREVVDEVSAIPGQGGDRD